VQEERMLRRQFIPCIVTLLAAFLCGGSAARLHLLAVFFARPILALAFTALLLFVVQRSSELCRSLLLGWVTTDFVRAVLTSPPCRHLRGYIDLQRDIPRTPCLRTHFQRPPPAHAR
jgi:hypothetical protein